MATEIEDTSDDDCIEVHLKIPKPDSPKVIVAPAPKPADINITNITTVNAPRPEMKMGVMPQERPEKAPPSGQMKSSGYSTAKKVEKFGSILEKDAVAATQEFKRRGFTVKDSRAS